MSDPDLRDPRVDEAYRRIPGDEPPPELDERIRAAARRAVGARPQSLGRRSWAARWRVPLSLAATVVITVTLTLMVQEEEHRPLQDSPARAPAPAAPPVVETPAPSPAAEAAKRKDAEPSRAPKPAAPPFASPAPPPPQQAPAANTAAPAATPELQKLEPRQQRIEEPAAPASAPAPKPRAAEAPATPAGGASDSLSRERAVGERPARDTRSAPQVSRSPEEWLEEIRRLKAQGRHAEAAAELAEFRRRHPEYPLPADLAR